mgnify:CR=1 FL=1
MEKDCPRTDLEGGEMRDILLAAVKKKEQETLLEKIFLVKDQLILLEITQFCRTGCPYCYKDGKASLEGSHLSLHEIDMRLSWLRKFSDAVEVAIVGGEPLLHPQFKEILDLIIQKGLRPRIITSGVTSAQNNQEQENLKTLFEKYEAGELDLDLSFHPDRNTKAFQRILHQVKTAASNRLVNLQAKLAQLDKAEAEALTMPVSEPAFQELINIRRQKLLTTYLK